MNDESRSWSLLLGAGAVFFPSVHTLIRYVLANTCMKRFSLGDVFLISEKCTSSIQAILSFIAGIIIVNNVGNIMTDTHWLSNSYAWFALPYFAFDVWAMYLTYKWNQNDTSCSLSTGKLVSNFVFRSKLMLLHHIVLPLIIFPTIIFFRKNLGDFFVGTFYMIEITIPFIGIREILVQLHLKYTPYYVVTGLLMVVSFFITRILVFPYLYHSYALYAGLPFMSVPKSIPLKCSLGCLLIFMPQLYWFGLMLRGTVRVLYKIYINNHKKHPT